MAIKKHLMNPSSSDSIILFIIGSIFVGFAMAIGNKLGTMFTEKMTHKAKSAIEDNV